MQVDGCIPSLQFLTFFWYVERQAVDLLSHHRMSGQVAVHKVGGGVQEHTNLGHVGSKVQQVAGADVVCPEECRNNHSKQSVSQKVR